MRSVVAMLTMALAGALALPALAQQDPAGAGGAPQVKQKPAPRTLVLTFGRADQGELAPKVQGLSEETLLDLRFPLVDESQVIAHYQLADLEKFLILTPELVRIGELKARFGAELICVVQYTRQFQYEKEYFGAKQRYFKNDVRVKMIYPDTAEILHSGGAMGTIEARQTELESLVKAEVRKAAEKVLERWSYEAVGPTTYQIFARGFDHAGVQALEAALRARQNVREVVERDYGGTASGAGNALIEVKFQGTVDELKSTLGTLDEPAVEIKSATPNRIEVVPAMKMKVGFAAPREGEILAGAETDVEVNVTGGRPAHLDVSGVAASAGPAVGTFRARVSLKPGENTLVARAVDALGREASAQLRVVCDAEPPQVRLVAPAAGFLTNKKQVEVVVEASDASGVAEVVVNGAALKPTADGLYTGTVELPDGKHELVAVAQDRAGRKAETRAAITIDSVPPKIQGKVQAVIAGKVDKQGVTLTIDGKPIALDPDGSFRVIVEAPAGGVVTVVAIDAAGNRSEQVYQVASSK